MSWLEQLVQRSRRLLQARAQRHLPPRPRVAVVTDSAAALPAEWVAQPDIADWLRIVPMPVMISGQIYGDGMDDVRAALLMGLAEGKEIKTSRPSPGLFQRTYAELEGLGFDAIVSVHISAELSGTVEAAGLAAAGVGIPVEVVDTRTVAMCQGFAVIAAVLAAQTGAEAREVADRARAAARASDVVFYVPSLEQLRRGGRVGAAAGFLGSLLAIKPLLGVRDGAIVPLERIRTAAKAQTRLQQLAIRRIEQLEYSPQLAVHYFGNEAEAQELARQMSAHVGDPVLVTPVPSVLAAHTGLGVLAVVIGPELPGAS
ncbi:DegV family protein [Arthrobacter mobilis]|uniref:DegV family protein n=1 Tax=Arthrobacter mobilis TaxID=2724944 RepID=UPI0028B0F13D|nr:DegV family protein [Arthrobacter mobilis]